MFRHNDNKLTPFITKGASILRMLENTVGAENFRTGVTNYLNKYRYGNAVTQNFLHEIQAVVRELKQFQVYAGTRVKVLIHY